MPNTITGRVLSVGQPLQVAGKDPSRPFIKRDLLLDCTRHDPYTGERSQYENTPLLEFGGDICRDLDNIMPGDIVTVTFSIDGTRYKDKTTQQEKIFTRIRPYKIEKYVRSQNAAPQALQQPLQAQTQPVRTTAQPPQQTPPQAQQMPQYDPMGYDPFPPPDTYGDRPF